MGINYFRLKLGTDTVTEYLLDNDCRLAKNYEEGAKVYFDDCTEEYQYLTVAGVRIGIYMTEENNTDYWFTFTLGESRACVLYQGYSGEYGMLMNVGVYYTKEWLDDQQGDESYDDYGLTVYMSDQAEIYDTIYDSYYNDGVQMYDFIKHDHTQYGITINYIGRLKIGLDSNGYYFYAAD